MSSNSYIEIAVVGHDKEKFPKLHSNILKPAILHELNFDDPIYATNSLGESRFFLANNFFSNAAEVVGCLTASWDKKYFPNKLDTIDSWPQAKYFESLRYNENIVLCTTLCYGKYAKPYAPLFEKHFQDHFRTVWKNTEEITDILYNITGFKYDNGNVAPYANQIICNKNLFIKLCNFIKSIINDIINHIGLYPKFFGVDVDPNRTLAYIMEEVTMLWWSKQTNIQYIQCAKITPGWYKK